VEVDRDAAKKATFCKQKINKSGEKNFFNVKPVKFPSTLDMGIKRNKLPYSVKQVASLPVNVFCRLCRAVLFWEKKNIFLTFLLCIAYIKFDFI